jgi:hypothetical protein
MRGPVWRSCAAGLGINRGGLNENLGFVVTLTTENDGCGPGEPPLDTQLCQVSYVSQFSIPDQPDKANVKGVETLGHMRHRDAAPAEAAITSASTEILDHLHACHLLSSRQPMDPIFNSLVPVLPIEDLGVQ